MSRRGGIRFGRRASGSLPKFWYGITTAATSAHYDTPNPGGVAGDPTGHWLSVAFYLASQSVNATRLTLRSNGSTAGHFFAISSNNSLASYTCYDGSTVAKASATYSIAAGRVGTVVVLTGVFTGAGNQVLLYALGSAVGSPTTCTGYTPFSGVMNYGAVAALNGVYIIGSAGGTGVVPSAGEVAAHSAGVYGAHDMIGIPGKTDHLWSVKQDAPGDLSAPVQITDRVGTDHMAKTGAPTLAKLPG